MKAEMDENAVKQLNGMLHALLRRAMLPNNLGASVASMLPLV